MNNMKSTNNLCFYCECSITDDDRIHINSITNAGLKKYISKMYKDKLLVTGNVIIYNNKLMHLHCYSVIESKYESI